MILSTGLLSLVWRTLDLVLMSVILGEFILAAKYDGRLLKAWIYAWSSIIMVFVFPFLSVLDVQVDISPGWDLHWWLENFIWVAYANLFPWLVYLLWTIHHRGMAEKNGA